MYLLLALLLALSSTSSSSSSATSSSATSSSASCCCFRCCCHLLRCSRDFITHPCFDCSPTLPSRALLPLRDAHHQLLPGCRHERHPPLRAVRPALRLGPRWHCGRRQRPPALSVPWPNGDTCCGPGSACRPDHTRAHHLSLRHHTRVDRGPACTWPRAGRLRIPAPCSGTRGWPRPGAASPLSPASCVHACSAWAGGGGAPCAPRHVCDVWSGSAAPALPLNGSCRAATPYSGLSVREGTSCAHGRTTCPLPVGRSTCAFGHHGHRTASTTRTRPSPAC